MTLPNVLVESTRVYYSLSDFVRYVARQLAITSKK